MRRPPNDVSRRSENEKKKEPPTSATDLLKDASRRSGKEKQKEPPILAPDPPEDASRRSKSEEQDEPPTPAPDLPEDAPHLSDPEEDLLPKEEAALFKQQKYYFEYLLNERVNLPLKIFDHEIQRADWVQRLTSHLYKTEYRECFNVLVFRVDLLLDTKITGIEREILVPWYDCKDEEFMFWVRNPRQEEDMLLLEKNAGTDDDIMPIVGKKKGHGEPKLGLISYMTLVFKDGKVTSKEASRYVLA